MLECRCLTSLGEIGSDQAVGVPDTAMNKVTVLVLLRSSGSRESYLRACVARGGDLHLQLSRLR